MSQGVRSEVLRARMPELDSLRGIAVLAVILYHGFFWTKWPLPAGVGRVLVRATEPGWAGVDLFFALSGFLITGILLDGREKPGYFRTFYVRRALRIWPAYFALIALLALTAHVGLPFVVVSTFFASNLSVLLGVPMQYGPLWSLAVEEQFYLVWPLVARVTTRRMLVGIALALVLLEPVLRYRTASHLGAAFALTEVDHRTWLRLDGLALGGLLALFLRSSAGTRRNLARLTAALAATALVLTVASAPFGGLDRTRPVGGALELSIVALVAGALLGSVLLMGTGRLRPLATLRPLRFLGEISYGLYLVHVLAFWWYDGLASRFAPALVRPATSFALLCVRFMVAGTFAMTTAYLSRRYFEEPFLRLKGRLARERGGGAAAAPAPVAVTEPAPERAAATG